MNPALAGRGAVNWGAEKNRTVTCAELGTEKSDPHKTRKSLKNNISLFPGTVLSIRHSSSNPLTEADGIGIYCFLRILDVCADGMP
jgi:hypothetical protein